MQARTDDVANNPDVVKLLRSIGTYWIMCGVESGLIERLKELRRAAITGGGQEKIEKGQCDQQPGYILMTLGQP